MTLSLSNGVASDSILVTGLAFWNKMARWKIQLKFGVLTVKLENIGQINIGKKIRM